ncbi:hypothetical protein [Streptomyces griseoaurantiacus]|uniref:Uncharacterized protein n=1 Tax=Streptomyces griseoaurantiacus TaxID=68213 RepID=A0A7W2DSL3_9ACTN|nr:hypothetical protein [Streptomyces griseoaurantiacus]MBA5222240.1 hypothetical protein [Streptomyces griseoaurantiacus]
MNQNSKKGPEGPFHNRPGGPKMLNSIVPSGPDGRVVREVFLPNTNKEIEPGPFGDGITLPAGSAIVLYVDNGNRMSWETARILGKSLALCSFIQVQGQGIGPSGVTAHYLYGLEDILRGIRAIAAEEAADLDLGVTA